MDNNEQQIHIVELSLEEAKRIAELGEAIRRLENNRDFKKVILDGYFTDEARRCVMLTADINLSPESKEANWAAIRGIGELRQFFIVKKQMAEIAKKEIESNKEMLDELRGAEDAEGSE